MQNCAVYGDLNQIRPIIGLIYGLTLFPGPLNITIYTSESPVSGCFTISNMTRGETVTTVMVPTCYTQPLFGSYHSTTQATVITGLDNQENIPF